MVPAVLLRLYHPLYFWRTTTEKAATNGDLFRVTHPESGETIMQVLHWKPVA